MIETHPALDAGAKSGMKLVLVGQFADEHLGFHLSVAARDLGLDLYPLDASKAMKGPDFSGKRIGGCVDDYNRLVSFSSEVERCCREVKPDFVLTTGLAPVEAAALRQIHAMGAITGNYLTDDPWNAAHRAAWFLEALPCYDHVFSPRRATLDDLRRAGCPSVHYLPFAYAPDIHHPEEPTPEERAALSSTSFSPAAPTATASLISSRCAKPAFRSRSMEASGNDSPLRATSAAARLLRPFCAKPFAHRRSRSAWFDAPIAMAIRCGHSRFRPSAPPC